MKDPEGTEGARPGRASTPHSRRPGGLVYRTGVPTISTGGKKGLQVWELESSGLLFPPYSKEDVPDRWGYKIFKGRQTRL